MPDDLYVEGLKRQIAAFKQQLCSHGIVAQLLVKWTTDGGGEFYLRNDGSLWTMHYQHGPDYEYLGDTGLVRVKTTFPDSATIVKVNSFTDA